MRPDFSKLFNEGYAHARAAEACVRKGRAPRDLDDLPSFEGIADARRRGWDRKEFRPRRTGVLRRWLASNVGRPWAAVFSEIASVSDLRSGARRDLRDAVLSEVETDTFIDADGVVKIHRGWGDYEPLARDFYVHPADGTLRRAADEPRRRRTPPVDPDAVEINAERGFRRIDGIWHEVHYAPMPLPETVERVQEDGSLTRTWTEPMAYDIVLKKTVRRLRRCSRYGVWFEGPERYAFAKRTLSSKELRQARLANDPDARDARARRLADRSRPG